MRSQFVESFHFSDFRCSVSTWACGRDTHHDTSGRCTQNSGVSFTVVMHFRYVSEHGYHWAHAARIRHVAPPPLICVFWRVVNTVALLEGEPLRNTRFAEADLRGASTGREVAHRLAYPHRGHGVTAVPRPATLTKQRAPQDPHQDSTLGRVESGQKRSGTADGIC